MVLAHEDDNDNTSQHPYWYGRIIGIFHADVRYVGPLLTSIEPHHMDVLWVRWLGRDLSHNTGFRAKRLHRIGFVDGSDPEAFGFLDPCQIIRAVHLIPAFAYGRTSELLGPSIIRQPKDNGEDWRFFYVNMYVFFCSTPTTKTVYTTGSLIVTCLCASGVAELGIKRCGTWE
jgi:hypothetical protein